MLSHAQICLGDEISDFETEQTESGARSEIFGKEMKSE